MSLILRNSLRIGSVPYDSQAAAPASTLLNGLVSYWTMDEVSGVRKDSIVASGNDLTDNNTVGSAAGINNLAASFVAVNNESLTKSAMANLGGVFTVSAWAYLTTTGVEAAIVAKGTTWANALEFDIYDATGAGGYRFIVGDDSSGFQEVNMGTLNTGAWYNVVVWLDSDKKPRSSINNGTTQVGAALAGTPYSAASTLSIGARWDGARPFNGLVDEVGVWSRVLMDDERIELYAAGAGKFYPFA